MFQYLSTVFWLAAASFSLSTVTAVSVPDCQTTAPKQNTLDNVRTSRIGVPGNPFAPVYSKRSDIAFVSIENGNSTAGGNSTLGVLNTTTFTPSLIHQIPLPAAYLQGAATGLALTHDGRHVLVAAGPGAIIVDVERAIHGRADAVVGALNGNTSTENPGLGAIEVTVSPDDKYVFVSQEEGAVVGYSHGNVDVFELQKPTSNGSVTGTVVGFQELGIAVVGTALSPDGRLLYATSEAINWETTFSEGSLSVVDVEALEKAPGTALLSNTTAGCGAVRLIVSSDGSTVWVTARESNRLLAFDAAKLLCDPDQALLASVQVGTSPVGLIFARNGSRLLTADSNRFEYTNTTSGLSVVDVQAALAGEQAVLGRIPTGLFPREFGVSPDGSTILVTDYASKEVQAIDVATLP